MTETPFGDLDDYFALPRVSGLAVSADGSRVVTTISELNEKRTELRRLGVGTRPEGQNPCPQADQGCQGRVGTWLHRERRPVVRRGAPDRGRRQAARGVVESARGRRRGRRGPGTARRRRGRQGGARRRAGRCACTAVCRRQAPSTTTVGCGIYARTPRSPRSCIPAIRSGTGTPISAPPPRICSRWI